MNLYEIKDPSFLKTLSKDELELLAKDIREFLLEHISKTGGHLSSNLGVIELTIAMHYIFSSPKDKLIFDVGHQCYTHKILTGRAKEFDTLRKFNGLSGFINKKESIHDVWESGHSSTSISAQCGFLLGKEKNDDSKVVVLIGDSSIMNGASMEALNYMGAIKDLNPIIILNDNKMSISSSVGVASRSLSRFRSSRFYQKINNFFAKRTPGRIRKFFHKIKTSIKGFILQENLFEDWGYDYMGPYDGNDLEVCIKTLKAAKNLNKPCVVHFVTTKGKGYKLAEEDKIGLYHGVGTFDLKEGIKNSNLINKSYSRLVSDYLLHRLEKEKFFVITPAMIRGGELEQIKNQYPDLLIDAGMAEEHATILASALVQDKQKAVLLLYSTFAQRAYDYLLNDIGRDDVSVIVGIDRADIVPGDGETHQGIYDISMFMAMPNYIITMPKDGDELQALFDYGFNCNHPFVIRYPKGNNIIHNKVTINEVSWTKISSGTKGYIITYGECVSYMEEIIRKYNLDITLINARFIRPMDENMLCEILSDGKPILIYERVVKSGSLSEKICSFAFEHNLNKAKIKAMTIKDSLNIPCGDVNSLIEYAHLGENDILKCLDELIK